jgi:hypothetical protein
MRIRDIILLEMSYADAIDILQRHDSSFPTRNISKRDITIYRRRFAKKYHPDFGHTGEELKLINAALDVVSKSPNEPDIRYYHTKREEPRQEKTSYYPGNKDTIWAQAGWSGGLPNDDTIYRDDFTNLNYLKKKAWEASGSKPNPTKWDEFTFWQFDGHFSRSVTSVFAKLEVSLLRKIASWFIVWVHDYKSQAICVTGRQIGNKKVRVFLVKDGKIPYSMFELTHSSFNQNPFNDKDFVEKLKRILGTWSQ